MKNPALVAPDSSVAGLELLDQLPDRAGGGVADREQAPGAGDFEGVGGLLGLAGAGAEAGAGLGQRRRLGVEVVDGERDVLDLGGGAGDAGAAGAGFGVGDLDQLELDAAALDEGDLGRFGLQSHPFRHLQAERAGEEGECRLEVGDDDPDVVDAGDHGRSQSGRRSAAPTLAAVAWTSSAPLSIAAGAMIAWWIRPGTSTS